jgi:hypothetical protein
MICFGLIWQGIGTSDELFEHDNKPLGYKKWWGVFGLVENC